MNVDTNHWVLIGLSASIYLVLSLIIAVMPAFESQKAAPTHERAVQDASVVRGRTVYLKEGCGMCHTQFLRDLAVDAPYGRGSVAGDYALEDPPLLGSQRTGPDLSNVGVRQPSDIWNLIHLFNPRAVVATSVMPAYPWYFETKSEADPGDTIVPVPEQYRPAGKVVIAKEEVLDLVRYLQSLKQPALEQ